MSGLLARLPGVVGSPSYGMHFCSLGGPAELKLLLAADSISVKSLVVTPIRSQKLSRDGLHQHLDRMPSEDTLGDSYSGSLFLVSTKPISQHNIFVYYTEY